MMLRRYLLAINDLTTEHPHKLPDLLFKEHLRFLSEKTANFSGLRDRLSTCNSMFVCDLRNIFSLRGGVLYGVASCRQPLFEKTFDLEPPSLLALEPSVSLDSAAFLACREGAL